MFDFVPTEHRAKFSKKLLVNKITGCWLWTAFRSEAGYGIWDVAGAFSRTAHRIAYEWKHGFLDKNLVLDHLCKNKACVNPGHLEPVSYLENIMRGNGCFAKNARKEECPRGHELTSANLVESQLKLRRRECKTCHNELTRELKKEERLDWISTHGHNSEKTHCASGHLFTVDNLVQYSLKHGERKCKTCAADQVQKQYLKKLEEKGKTPTHLGMNLGQYNAAKTHCKNGHELKEPNLVLSRLAKGQRLCLTCKRAYDAIACKKSRAKKKAAKLEAKSE